MLFEFYSHDLGVTHNGPSCHAHISCLNHYIYDIGLIPLWLDGGDGFLAFFFGLLAERETESIVTIQIIPN